MADYQHYRDFKFQRDTKILIVQMIDVIDLYRNQGYVLSVRQLYYQMVSKNIVANTEANYKRVASVLNDARYAGLIPWDAIEDRNRDIEMKTRWPSAQSIIEASRDSFHMDRWDNQDTRVFVIVEKAALAGVLEPVCRKFDVPMLAARGYPSVSIVREMVVQHVLPAMERGQHVEVLHLGDHDPSGIDMTRDLEARFTTFINGCDEGGVFTLSRIALTMPQIEEKKPPPNPAKNTDSRFGDYRRKYGSSSWELDALEPAYLANLVTQHIDDFIDPSAWEESFDMIDEKRKELAKVATTFMKKGI